MLLQLGIIALLIVAAFFGERWLRKRLHIPNTRGFFYKRVNKTQSWIENGLVVLFLVIDFFYAFFLDGNPSSILFIIILGVFFLALQTVRFFYEWNYRKEDREYIMILIGGIGYIPIMGVILFLFL
jgi:hypothetical protein